MAARPGATDWDAYYARPATFAPLTRRITAARIQRTLVAQLAAEHVSVCELGGANSCFVDDFLLRPSLAAYRIIDTNKFGLDMVASRHTGDGRVRCELADVLMLEPGAGGHDIVYSVGLIEHFDTTDTARCIASHFNLCRPGGAVLVTFPTPTWLYRGVRGAAELAGVWSFPDERPLQYEEVASACSRHGEVIHHSINWAIGLTQGYVLARKR